jgi:hypothetical protein
MSVQAYDLVLSIEWLPTKRAYFAALTVLDGDIVIKTGEWAGDDAAELLFESVKAWFKWSRFYEDNPVGVPEMVNEQGYRQLSMFPLPTEP